MVTDQLRENAEGSSALGEMLRHRANHWRVASNIEMSRGYVKALIIAQKLAEELSALAEKEESHAKR